MLGAVTFASSFVTGACPERSRTGVRRRVFHV
jgi:hypothetical protein